MTRYSDITTSELKYQDIWIQTRVIYDMWMSECDIGDDVPHRARVISAMYVETVRYFFERYIPTPSAMYIPTMSYTCDWSGVYTDLLTPKNIAVINEIFRYLNAKLKMYDHSTASICYLVKKISEHDILVSKGY